MFYSDYQVESSPVGFSGSKYFLSVLFTPVNICSLSETALLVCCCLWGSSAAFPLTEVQQSCAHLVSCPWEGEPSRACSYLLKNSVNSTPRKHFCSSTELPEAYLSVLVHLSRPEEACCLWVNSASLWPLSATAAANMRSYRCFYSLLCLYYFITYNSNNKR